MARADAVLIEPAPVRVLGIDETRRGRPRWTQDADSGRWVRLERFGTNFVDLAGPAGLLVLTYAAPHLSDDIRSPLNLLATVALTVGVAESATQIS